jgi:hypothetical protein
MVRVNAVSTTVEDRAHPGGTTSTIPCGTGPGPALPRDALRIAAFGRDSGILEITVGGNIDLMAFETFNVRSTAVEAMYGNAGLYYRALRWVDFEVDLFSNQP